MIKPTNQAFSLAEILMSLGFLSFCLLSLAAVFSFSLRLSSQNRDSQQASQIAAQFFENCRGKIILPGSYSGLPSGGDFPPAPYPRTNLGERVFHLRLDASSVPGRTNLFQLDLTITWGNSHQARFATRVFQP